jgi:hypothetical protein
VKRTEIETSGRVISFGLEPRLRTAMHNRLS